MAEDKVDLRDVSARQLLPWAELFRAFHIAIDYRKVLLAALGLLAMSVGWWLLSEAFYQAQKTPPDWKSGAYSGEDQAKAWARFKADRAKWDLMYEAAGPDPLLADANDLATTPGEFDEIRSQIDAGRQEFEVNGRLVRVYQKPYGRLRTLPWFEDRGPNPYLLVTGQAGHVAPGGTLGDYPWERGRFWDWLLTKQVPFLIEPLVKLLRPVVYLLQDNAGFWNCLYFTLALLWSLAVWALFGGAVTRMAAVEAARREKTGIGEALRFTLARYLSFLSAPLIPLAFVVVILLFLIVFGLFHMIPLFGEVVVDTLGWFLVLGAGIVAALVLAGLAGWPMMYATLSAEGSDAFDALSRSYSYVYQSPWRYIWYCLVSLAYGAVVVFFVVFMGSLAVYLGKWGISQTPWISTAGRSPDYLFVYAPRSLGWRELLLHRSPALTADGTIEPGFFRDFHFWNYVGAVTVGGFWLYSFFLLVVGFSYSYFWSASTIIYLLMRRHVDDTELDEVYLEEEEADDLYQAPYGGAAPSPPATGATPLTVVEPPGAGPTAPAAASSARVEPATGASGPPTPPETAAP